MDYLRRDAYFCGVSYGFFEYGRLINTLAVEDGRIVVDEGGIGALESFLLGRYFMYSQVYFHRVVRIINLHLLDFIKELQLYEEIKDINSYIRQNDSLLVSKLFSEERYSVHVERIFGRKHFREVFSTDREEEFLEARRLVEERFEPSLVKFDRVFKRPFDESIYVRRKKGDLARLEEVSAIASSLKPIRIYSIYAEPAIKDEVCSLLKA